MCEYARSYLTVNQYLPNNTMKSSKYKAGNSV